MKRMLRGAVLLCVLAAAVVAQENFYEAYGRQKIMTTCFGEEVWYSQVARFEHARERCRSQPLYIPGLQPAINTYNIIAPSFVPSNAGYAYPAPPAYPTLIPATGDHRPVHGKARTERRAEDQLFVDRDAILVLIDVVHAALSNYTCMLRSLDIIDDNLNVRLDVIHRDYHQVPIDNVLRHDLLEGIDVCHQLTACLPVDKVKSSLPSNLERLLFFVKCERKSRINQCLKHDLRRNLFRFDLSALPDGDRMGKLETLTTLLIAEGSREYLEEL